MVKARRGWHGKKQVSGAKIGARSVKVRQCANPRCEIQYPPGQKPDVCIGCGRLDFITFDSTAEAGRWATLKLLAGAGKISDLQRQVRFDLFAARVIDGRTVASKVGQYVADHVYVRDGKKVIEDVKGAVVDPLAVWKLRHMEAQGLPVTIYTD